MVRMEQSLAQKVAAQVRAEAEDRGWSQSELARRSGVPRLSLRRYYYVGDREPTLDATAAVARALGVPLPELLRRAEEATGAPPVRKVRARPVRRARQPRPQHD